MQLLEIMRAIRRRLHLIIQTRNRATKSIDAFGVVVFVAYVVDGQLAVLQVGVFVDGTAAAEFTAVVAYAADAFEDVFQGAAAVGANVLVVGAAGVEGEDAFSYSSFHAGDTFFECDD